MKLARSLAAIIPLLALIAGCGRSPGETVKQFYKAQSDNDPATLKACLTKQAATQNGKMIDFDAKFNANFRAVAGKELPKLDHVDIQSESKAGDTATVTFTVHMTGDTASPKMQATLVKEDGEWKIQNLMPI